MSVPATLEAPERERQERAIQILEEIKAEHGSVWAVYASAFYHGSRVAEWRQALADEIEAAL